MAIFHLNVKNLSRNEGRSVVAAAAYRAGEVLPNEAEERLSDFGGRRDVVATEIRLPAGAPDWMAERSSLWNAVEATEKRKDARLAKEVEFALPLELPRSAWLSVARTMADAYTVQGFVVDLAIHDDGTRHNPHVHMLMTTRVVNEAGFGLKIRSADGKQFVTEARALWERIANDALSRTGATVTVDSRSYVKRGLDRPVGQHRGPNREERRARRTRAQRERDKMAPRDRIRHPSETQSPDIADAGVLPGIDYHPDEADLPVPDPDGSPIHPNELAAAEQRLIDDMHRPAPGEAAATESDRAGAQAAVDRQNALEVSEEAAAAYRLSPEDMLDWLGDKTRPEDVGTLERWENHLDWLQPDGQSPVDAHDDGPRSEPDRDSR